MQIEHNKSLKPYNTFGIDASARRFVAVQSVGELQQILADDSHPEKFILGGGSNVLLTNDIDGLVVHIDIKGRSVVGEGSGRVQIQAGAGENWHGLVMYCVGNDYGGIENLSLIPGNAGTAPIQNIGAYGVELKDVFVSCEAVSVKDGKTVTFSAGDCRFGYRDSIFKNSEKGNYIITGITLQLTGENHRIHTEYGDIREQLERMDVENPGIKDVSDAVIAIRRSKLPDPAEIGNSGSFFKNPVLGVKQFEAFSKSFPEAPFYKVSDEAVKIPAGWLIEQAGFRGKRYGDAGVHARQALVLVNYGDATGRELLDLAKRIQKTVREQFGISLETEVNIV